MYRSDANFVKLSLCADFRDKAQDPRIWGKCPLGSLAGSKFDNTWELPMGLLDLLLTKKMSSFKDQILISETLRWSGRMNIF